MFDPVSVSRRWFLQECGVGLGAIALADLLRGNACANPPVADAPGSPTTKAPHFPAKAKRVIYLFMAGAPSHLELFDYKPQLAKFDGTLPPPELLEGYRAAFINPSSKLLGPKFKFAKHGQCGAELGRTVAAPGRRSPTTSPSSKAMVTDAFNHAPAQILMNTGAQQFGRPSFGSWVTYGLGSESPRPAGVRRVQLRGQGAERRQLQLGQRLPAHRLPRRAVPRRPAIRCCTCPTRAASTPPLSGTRSIRSSEAEQAAARRRRRPGDRDAH